MNGDEQLVAGFDVIRVLSEGASAEVLLARQQNTGKSVILEMLRPELVSDATVVRHFRAAVSDRRAAVHPGLIGRVGEGSTPDGRLYVISDPVGHSLATHLAAKGALSLVGALQVLESVCEALRFLHERGVVHSNVKPSMVYVEPAAVGLRARLLDCGLMLLRPGRSLKIPASRILVEAEYMAPERIRGQRGTAASDIYAVGVLLFEMLTGFPPFTGPDSNAVRRLHLEGTAPDLPAHLAEAQGLVSRCLKKAPGQRFGSIADLIAAVHKLSSQMALDETVVLDVDVEVFDDASSEILGSYRLVEPLGEGAIGRVFRAKHVTLDRQVALKVMKPEHLRYPEVVARFVQEAQAVSRIKHAHIVEVFDIIVDDAKPGLAQRAYIVMELLAGKSLSGLLKPGPLALSRVIRICRQIASALDAAHRCGIVHRDVKPDNIFICDRGGDFAKVLDFGVAKLRGEKQSSDGFAVGTPMYMAPEQVSDEGVDHRVDVYALGVVLFRALTGKMPFSGARNELELFGRILNEVPEKVPATTVGGEPIPLPLRSLVDRCLEKSSEKRPQSMAEIASVLDGLMARDAVEVKHAAPRRKGRVLAAAMVALAGLGGVVFALTRPAATPDFVKPAAVSPAEVRISVLSNPEKASVTRIDTSQLLGLTPLEVRLPLGDGTLSLRVEKQGHLPETVAVHRDRNQAIQVTLGKRLPAPAPPPRKPSSVRKVERKKVDRDDLLNPF